jgi:tripartite-type tricarboxylate transporter receptor subunit TctC
MICCADLSRRRVLAAVVAGATLASLSLGFPASAQEFPSRNISITIPTGEGGGADRDARIFTQILKKHLDTDFEFEYYPGAAGQVGYEFYARKEPDAHNLLFSNIGPEVIMLTLQDPGIKVGEDIVYIQQTSSEPMAVWVGPNSPFQTLEALVEEAKKRPVTVAVSRLPHPGSIGMLALGEATGATFNLVPFGGGNPAAMAAITGEVDASVLPLANPIQLADQARILGIFGDRNPAPEMADNAPTVNEALGTDLPALTSSRAWAVQGKTLQEHPEQVEKLKQAMQQTLADPEYAAAVEAAGLPTAFIDPGDQDTAMASAEATRQLAEKYRSLLTGG